MSTRNETEGTGITATEMELQPPSNPESDSPLPHLRPLANPTPVGLCAFALTAFVLSLILLQTRNVTIPNIVVGLAFFYGGLVHTLSGIGSFIVGNTFETTVLCGYGGFWLSYTTILGPSSFNIVSAYTSNEQELHTAIAFFLFGWFIFTFFMLIAVLRHSIALIFLFATLDVGFLSLAIGEYVSNQQWTRAGGGFVLCAASAAWYCALSMVLDKTHPLKLPLGLL